MNNKILISVVIVLSILLACSPKGDSGEPESASTTADVGSATERPNAEPAVGPGKGHAKGKLNRRTWVVYEYSELDTEHVAPGDAFRIQKTGNSYKLKALTALHKRWSKPANFMVDLVEGTDDLLCGQVELAGHTEGQEHVLKFNELDADKLEVQIEIFDVSKSLEDQCEPSTPIHGGRAHAEN
ncbi:MAG: hypothetical protein ACR2RD_06665 [Woeseiaceae bacterium]